MGIFRDFSNWLWWPMLDWWAGFKNSTGAVKHGSLWWCEEKSIPQGLCHSRFVLGMNRDQRVTHRSNSWLLPFKLPYWWHWDIVMTQLQVTWAFISITHAAVASSSNIASSPTIHTWGIPPSYLLFWETLHRNSYSHKHLHSNCKSFETLLT